MTLPEYKVKITEEEAKDMAGIKRLVNKVQTGSTNMAETSGSTIFNTYLQQYGEILDELRSNVASTFLSHGFSLQEVEPLILYTERGLEGIRSRDPYIIAALKSPLEVTIGNRSVKQVSQVKLKSNSLGNFTYIEALHPKGKITLGDYKPYETELMRETAQDADLTDLVRQYST